MGQKTLRNTALIEMSTCKQQKRLEQATVLLYIGD